MAEFNVLFEEHDLGFDAEFTSDDDAFGMDFDNTEVVEVPASDHDKLLNRDLPNQHPISSITGLDNELSGKLETIPALTNSEIDNILKGFV